MMEDNNYQDKNAGETPESNRNLMNGKETGKCFTSDNQPPADKKKEGWAKKKLVEKMLAAKAPAIIGKSNTNYAALAAAAFNIPESKVTWELLMHYRMMERATLQGDPRAYNAVMDRAKGKPAQPLTGGNGEALIPPEHKIVHVYSDVPLANSEEEIQD